MTLAKTQMAGFPSPFVTVPFQNNNTTNKKAALIVHIFLDKLQLFYYMHWISNFSFQFSLLCLLKEKETKAKIELPLVTLDPQWTEGNL